MPFPFHRRSLPELLAVVVLLAGCVCLVVVLLAVPATRNQAASARLAKVGIDGEAAGGVLQLGLRGSGGPPVDIAVPTWPGESAQSVADRLVREMRESPWPEQETWKPWVVGLRITQVDEVWFRCTDVGLHIHLTLATRPPRPYALVVRAEGSESTGGTVVVSGSGKGTSVAGSHVPFPEGQTSAQLLDRIERGLAEERWRVEREEEALVCREVGAGTAPTCMSLYVFLKRPDRAAGETDAPTWGLRLLEP